MHKHLFFAVTLMTLALSHGTAENEMYVTQAFMEADGPRSAGAGLQSGVLYSTLLDQTNTVGRGTLTTMLSSGAPAISIPTTLPVLESTGEQTRPPAHVPQKDTNTPGDVAKPSS